MISVHRLLFSLTLLLFVASYAPAQSRSSAAPTAQEKTTLVAELKSARDETADKAKLTSTAINNENEITTSSSVSSPAKSQSPTEGKLSRWVEIETASLATRYIFADDPSGATLANQNQYQVAFKGRFKFDAKGRYSIHAGVYAGNNFTGGWWSDTGWGRGRGSSNLYLRHLYFAAQPVQGVELQYGGLSLLGGVGTSITGFADSGYIMGQRVNVERPKNLFFDQVAVTYGYLGDLNTPNINKRYHRLRQSNYHQFLVSKNIGKRATISAHYTFLNGIEMMAEAVKLNTKELRVIDTFRFENYQRMDVKPDYGFAAHGEKTLFNRLILGGGFAQVDPNAGNLNSDAFFSGKRVFLSTTYAINSVFSVSTLWNRAVGNDFVVPKRTHFHLVFNYDLLKSLQRTPLF